MFDPYEDEEFDEKLSLLNKMQKSMLERISVPEPVAVFSESYGPPALCVDMLRVPPGEPVIVSLHMEAVRDDILFAIKLSAMGEEGRSYILPEAPTERDGFGGIRGRRCLTRLAEMTADKRANCRYRVKTTAGLLGVEYGVGCMIKLFGKDVSYYRFSKDAKGLAMIRTVVDAHTVRYSCVGSSVMGDCVFSLRWEPDSDPDGYVWIT